ncbi:MAG TPA: rod shape-determining protein MreC [Actinomycetota bacterium]|nr:rod shape-determining protein MreC [Actinomycetota bacterium]
MYRRTGRGRVLLVALLGVSIVLITLDFRQGDGGPLDRARDISSAVVDPIQRGFTAVFRPVGNFFSSVGELSSLRSRNAELESELEAARQQIDQAQALAEENAQLRLEAELDESWVSMDRLTAEVINKASSNFRWIVRINKGRSDGIRPDMAVVDSDGLVGKILSAEENSASVLLLIDPNGAAAAKIEGGKFTGSVNGQGSGEPLSFEFVDPNADIEVGDEVLTSYYNDGIFPPNIPIGRVIDVSAPSAALRPDVAVDPYVDFQALDFVQVLLESGPLLATDESDDQ